MSVIRRFTAFVVLLAGLAFLAPTAAQARTHQEQQKPTTIYGQTELTLSDQAAQALPALGVAPSLIGPAAVTQSGAFAFPISNKLGDILGTREIDHLGGIALTAGGTRLALTDFTIHLTWKPKPYLTAVVNGGDRITLLDLSFRGAGFVPRPGIALGPVQGTLTQQAADALNATFGVTAFTKGFPLGSATVVLRFPRYL